MFNAMSILSLLLALAVAASWVRSYMRHDFFGYYEAHHPSALIQVDPSRGRARFTVRSAKEPFYVEQEQERWTHFSEAPVDLQAFRHAFMGISWRKTYHRLGMWTASVIIPHAYLLLIFTALPAIRIYRSLRRRRLRLIGHCRVCGYDLRATPERCPECGAVTKHSDSPITG